MHYFQELLDPFDKMILECSLDGLVEEVGGKEFVYICAREFCGERLKWIG
jgi:hypothetical protein